MLCCPEDRICTHAECKAASALCTQCQVPVCTACSHYVMSHKPSLPPTALWNDMMIFYAPQELYANGGLVMEMICASPCITSMIWFSMEVKYGHMLDSKLQMHRHRVGARGNATTFLSPRESILSELQRLEAQNESASASTTLPRTGEDLRYVVQILLRTNDEDKRDNLKHFIHQARVKRAIVVQLILSMKRRGHRSYVHLDEEADHQRGQKLPVDGVPP